MKMSVATLPTFPRANRTIGAILMDAGLLSAEGAEQILRLQRQNSLRFVVQDKRQSIDQLPVAAGAAHRCSNQTFSAARSEKFGIGCQSR